MNKREDADALSMSQKEYVEKCLEGVKLDGLDDQQRRIVVDWFKNQHKQRVRQAFEGGLDIPKEVMGDYDFLNDDDMSDEELDAFIKKHPHLFEAVDDHIQEEIELEIDRERTQKSRHYRGGLDAHLEEVRHFNSLFRSNPFYRNQNAYLRPGQSEKVDIKKALLKLGGGLLAFCIIVVGFLIVWGGIGLLVHLLKTYLP